MSMHGVTKASSSALSPASRFREKSFKLDGVEDLVDIDAVAASGVLDWDHTKKWSVSIWFKTPGASFAPLWSMTRATGDTRWLEMYSNYSGATGQIAFRGYASSTEALLVSGAALVVTSSDTNGILPNDGNWHNVVLTVDSASGATGGVNIYLDGLLAGTGNNSDKTNDFEYMKVGALVHNGDNTTHWSPMTVSQFSVYNDELSAAQVANVWAGGNSIDERALTPAPVHLYRFGNDAAVFANVVDIGSVGTNGTAENMSGLEVVAEHPS